MKIFISLSIVLLLNSFTFAQVQNPERLDKRWQTDTTKHSVNLSEFIALMPRDGFQVLNYPKFLDKKEALAVFYKNEPVVAVEINNSAKAYSLNILSFHEISNDTLNGIPILVSYCPLCNTAIIFDRRLNVDGKTKTAKFGIAGMLRKSNMVMWDDLTESWWQQIMGEAVVGKLTNTQLKIIPSKVISVKEFFENYPNGKILSNKTGFVQAEKKYGKNMYVKYDSLGKNPKRFFQDKVDERLPAMERIVGLSVNGEYKAYPFLVIKKMGVINDKFNSQNLVIFYNSGAVSILDKKELNESKNIGSATVFIPRINGQILTFKKTGKGFTDVQTNSIWNISGKCTSGKMKGKHLKAKNYGTHFAFSWFSFFPATKVYK